MEGLNGKSPISSLLLRGFPQLVMASSFNGKTYLQEGGKPPFIGCQWQRLTRQRGKLGHQQQLLAAPSFSHIKLPNLLTFSSLFFHAIILLHEPLNQAHFIFSFNIIFFPAPSQLVFFVIGSFLFYPIFFCYWVHHPLSHLSFQTNQTQLLAGTGTGYIYTLNWLNKKVKMKRFLLWNPGPWTPYLSSSHVLSISARFLLRSSSLSIFPRCRRTV